MHASFLVLMLYSFILPATLEGEIRETPFTMATRRMVVVGGQRGKKSVKAGGGHDCDKDAASPAEFKTALENVIEIVKQAGGDKHHIVHLNNYLTDINDLPKLDEEYKKVFGNLAHFPTRTVVQVVKLQEGAVIEIDAIALIV